MAIKLVGDTIELSRTYTQALKPADVVERRRMLTEELSMIESDYLARKAALEAELAEVEQMVGALTKAGIKLEDAR
jgi:hypothetical protein